MFLEICMQFHSAVFALSRQTNKQMYGETIISFAQVITFLQNIKLKGRVLTPIPLLR